MALRIINPMCTPYLNRLGLHILYNPPPSQYVLFHFRTYLNKSVSDVLLHFLFNYVRNKYLTENIHLNVKNYIGFKPQKSQ